MRRATQHGAFVTVVSKGAHEAGTVFLAVNKLDGFWDLFGPAPQSMYDDDTSTGRQFTKIVEDQDETTILEKLKSEQRFDPDIWVLEIEDRQGRSFI